MNLTSEIYIAHSKDGAEPSRMPEEELAFHVVLKALDDVTSEDITITEADRVSAKTFFTTGDYLPWLVLANIPLDWTEAIKEWANGL